MGNFSAIPQISGPGSSPNGAAWRPPQWNQKQVTFITAQLPDLPEASVTTASINPNSPPTTTTEPATTKETNYYFDAVLRLQHDLSSVITRHPVQSGASFVDHVYLQPAILSMEIGMSDVMDRFQSGDYTSNSSKSVSAYQTLTYLRALRIPLTITTRLATYTNMVIAHISAPDDNRTFHGLRVSIRFEQIILGTVTLQSQSNRPNQTDTNNEGTVQPQPPDSGTSSAIDAVTGDTP
jgi:hypothetical protein